MMMSLPSLHWCHCQHCTGIVALVAPVLLSLLRWPSVPSHCMGIVTIVSPALLPPSSLHECAIALVSSPLSRWCCCPWSTGISTLVALASLPLLCLHCTVDLQASLPSLSWHVLSFYGQRGKPHRRQWQHQHNKGNDASTTRAATPAQQGQQCQHNEGNDTSTKRVTVPVQLTMPAWQEPMPAQQGQQCGQGGKHRRGVWV